MPICPKCGCYVENDPTEQPTRENLIGQVIRAAASDPKFRERLKKRMGRKEG